MTAKSWNVLPSKFPFGVATSAVGTVTGIDRDDAQKKAEDLYGRGVVVTPIHADPNPTEHSERTSRAARVHATLSHERVATRLMTNDEAIMAWAVATCPLLAYSKHRASMRMVHARSLHREPSERTITSLEAQTLRACVLTFKAKLPAEVVAIVERAP